MSNNFEEPYTLYEDLKSEFVADRKFINNKLLINTEFHNDINSTSNVIDAIYDSIERNTAGYSFSEYCFKQLDKDLISELTPKIFILRSYNPENVKNYRNDLKKKNDISFTDSNEFTKKELLIYEDAIKSHCIMKALYTVTYLLNKDITMTSPQFGFVAKNKGMNELNPLRIKKASLNIPKSDLGVWNNLFDSTLDTTFQSQLAIIYRYKSGKYERRKACFFLSDFSYDIVKNQGNTNSFHLEEKLRSIADNFHQSNKRLFNRHTKDFAEKYDKFCKEYMNCTSSNIVDNFLFYYKKELSFGHDLLCSFFQNAPINGLYDYTLSKNYHNRALCEIDEKNELLKLGLSLPNVFSRAYFMRTLIPKDMKDRHALNECKDKLLYLINIVFPIFERAFFISLFDHAKSIDEDNPLILMKTYLEEYIAKNYLRVTRNGYFARSSNPNNIISWAPLVIDKSYYNLFYDLIYNHFNEDSIKKRYCVKLNKDYVPRYEKSFMRRLNNIPYWIGEKIYDATEDSERVAAIKLLGLDKIPRYKENQKVSYLPGILLNINDKYKSSITSSYINIFLKQKRTSIYYYYSLSGLDNHGDMKNY